MARKTTAGVKLQGLDKAIKNMQARNKRMANSEPGFKVAGPIVVRAIKKMFRDTESPTGKKWKGKKPVAVKFANGEVTAEDRGYWVRGKFRPKRKTGVGLTGKLSTATSFVARRRELVVFNKLKYAGRFNEGFKGIQKVKSHKRKITRAFGKKLKKAKKIDVKAHSFPVNQPARPFLGASAKTRKRVTRAVIDYWFRGDTKKTA